MASQAIPQTSSSTPRIAVVGAGVIGLSVGLCLLETYKKQLDVTIVAEKFSPDTTSDHAGAIFIARSTEDTFNRRASGTFYRLKELYQYPNLREEIGLSLFPGYATSPENSPEKFSMVKGLLMNEKELSKEEMRALGPEYEKFQTVFSGSTFFVKGTKYLPWLMKRIREHGGLIVKQKLESLVELSAYDIVINCTGLGALELVGDAKMYPVRGQVVVVRAPKVTRFVHVHSSQKPGSTKRTYVLLHKDHAVLGGTTEPHNWSTVPDPGTAQDILERCCQVDPGLKGAEVIGGWACLRPTRESGVRLEVDSTQRDPMVVHNYGHGGYGVILSWGCAQETVQLVQQSLRSNGIVLTQALSKL